MCIKEQGKLVFLERALAVAEKSNYFTEPPLKIFRINNGNKNYNNTPNFV